MPIDDSTITTNCAECGAQPGEYCAPDCSNDDAFKPHGLTPDTMRALGSNWLLPDAPGTPEDKLAMRDYWLAEAEVCERLDKILFYLDRLAGEEKDGD